MANLMVQKVETGKDVKLNMLVYGKMGSGKTTFLGSAQNSEFSSPTLLVDIEGGVLSLSGSDVDIVRPQNFGEIQQIYDYLRFDNTTYKSVGIDSLTELQRKLSLGEIMGVLEDDSSYTNLAGHKPPTQYDWLSSGEQMRRFIRAFRDLAYLPDPDKRVNVIFCALEKKDENRGIICPSLPGLLGVEIGASVDVLGRLTVEKVPSKEDETKLVSMRYLSLTEETDPDGTVYLAKARVPQNSTFPVGIWNPTVDKVMRQWTDRLIK